MKKNNNDDLLWKYASLGTQLIVGLCLMLYIGNKIDSWIKFNSPLAIWILPLLFIVAIIIKVISETNTKK